MTRFLLLSTVLMTLGAPLLVAQSQPPYSLSIPFCWQVHDENGPIDVHIFVTGEYEGVYTLMTSGTYKGTEFLFYSIAIADGAGGYTVYNGDSGNWTTWEWAGEWYEKIGGTSHIRTYHPIYSPEE